MCMITPNLLWFFRRAPGWVKPLTESGMKFVRFKLKFPFLQWGKGNQLGASRLIPL